jgi:hypothetical protein
MMRRSASIAFVRSRPVVVAVLMLSLAVRSRGQANGRVHGIIQELRDRQLRAPGSSRETQGKTSIAQS